MASLLRAVMAYGRDLEDAVTAALNHYNEIDARKIFHKADVDDTITKTTEDGIIFHARVIIWFTANTDDPIEPDIPTFIGSQGIDPNDPDWREKIKHKQVWDKDRFQNAPVSLPEGSGATED